MNAVKMERFDIKDGGMAPYNAVQFVYGKATIFKVRVVLGGSALHRFVHVQFVQFKYRCFAVVAFPEHGFKFPVKKYFIECV